jgi:hypothetical protein
MWNLIKLNLFVHTQQLTKEIFNKLDEDNDCRWLYLFGNYLRKIRLKNKITGFSSHGVSNFLLSLQRKCGRIFHKNK